jgi:hypothetical protein
METMIIHRIRTILSLSLKRRKKTESWAQSFTRMERI